MTEDIEWKQYEKRFTTFPSLFRDDPDQDIEMFVCIPSYAEPDILDTLQSLIECDKTSFKTGVLILFNHDQRMSLEEMKMHEISWHETLSWISRHQTDHLKFYPIYLPDFPSSRGGVGLARKVLMDEAARKLPDEGVIISLDADCTVQKNYLNEIRDQFDKHQGCSAASVYFEHSLDSLRGKEKESIINYELHLRYLVNAQRWSGHPFAYHTVGSSMAVRRKDYLLQGGMNTRQAGEDFYFLQKFIEVGKLFQITSTTVYPGARISNRVPFGTGRAMQQILNEALDWKTTHFAVFSQIKPLFASLDKLRSLLTKKTTLNFNDHFQDFSSGLLQFLDETDFMEVVREISLHTSSGEAFQKRFFRYFNAFHMIRYMHWMRDRFYPDVSVRQGVEDLLRELSIRYEAEKDTEEYLVLMRRIDRNDLSEDLRLGKME